MQNPYLSQVGHERYSTDLSGVGGKLRNSPDDFVVREVSIVPSLSKTGRHTIAKVTARNWETNALLRILAKYLGIYSERIGFAGTKDKRAVTTQLLSFPVDEEKVSNLEIKDVSIDILGKSNRKIKLGELIGNDFTIKITNTKNTKDRLPPLISALKDGFPNYFGVQRFGSIRPITHLVGKEIVNNDFEEAVKIYLYAESNVEEEDRSFLRSLDNWEITLENLPERWLYERDLVKHLISKDNDFKGAIRKLPLNLSRLFVHAYQGAIFNKIIEDRLDSGIPLNAPQIGDLILPEDSNGCPNSLRAIEVTDFNLEKIEKRCSEGRAWVSGLIPGVDSKTSGGVQGEIENAALSYFEVEKEDFTIPHLPELSSFGKRRALHETPKNLTTEITDNGAIVNFALNKGSYATSFLREIIKSNDLSDY